MRTLLQRRLNRTDALAIALGGVIGVGVFRTTGLVLAGAGGVGGATALWLAVGVVCLCGALLYGDLAARVPEVGGPYAYVRVAFGDLAGFTYGWFDAGIAIPVRQASVMAVIGEVLATWFPSLGSRVLAVITLLVLTGLNLLGVHAGAITQRIFTAGKLLTLAFVIALALYAFGTDGTAVAGIPLAGDFASAIAGVWYTYLGWQDVVLLAEEVEQPQRALPYVLVTTVGVVLVIYTGLHLAIYAGLGGGSAATSQLPVSALADHVIGPAGVALLGGLMLASMIGGAAEGLMVRPRMALALARDGLGPRWLASVGRTGTPTGALVANSAVVLALVATGTFGELLPLLVFAQGLLGVIETTSYFIVRKRRPEWPTMRFHPWAPLVFILANVALCIVEGVRDPVRAGLALIVLAALAGGFAIYRSRLRASQM